MRAGTLDKRVALQQPIVTRDDYGHEVITWQTVATVWANIQTLRGREYFAAAAVQKELNLKIKIRHRADISNTWRVAHKGITYNIEAVIPLGRLEYQELMCNERSNHVGE